MQSLKMTTSISENRTEKNTEPTIVAALYHFATLPDYEAMRMPLWDFCKSHDVKGSLLLAAEGINGTIAGSRQGIDAVLTHLRADERLAKLVHKEAVHDEMPFYRMKVKLKKEIVTMGIDAIDPNHIVGTYVEPKDWNALISDPDVILIDTRNDYEVQIGTFEGAIDPDIATFREFPEYMNKTLDPAKHKKVAMFCTGGIRCEKSTAYAKAQGFEEVYHLQGGILKYIEEVPQEESLWHGECFVFDHRVSVNHQLEKGEYDVCHGCRLPIHEDDKKSEHYIAGVCCHKCYATQTPEQKVRFEQRQLQINLAKKRNQGHLGVSPPVK